MDLTDWIRLPEVDPEQLWVLFSDGCMRVVDERAFRSFEWLKAINLGHGVACPVHARMN